MLPHALAKRLFNHVPPNDVTEGYEANWTIGQLRDSAQRVADAMSCVQGPSGSMGGSRMSWAAAPCSRARILQGSRPPDVRHDRVGGQPTGAPYRSTHLIRLVTFAIIAAALPERRSCHALPKFNESTDSEAAQTLM